MTRFSIGSVSRGWTGIVGIAAAGMIALGLVAGAKGQDPDAVRALTEATGIPGAHGMACTDAQRRRVPCDIDGLQVRRFPDGSLLLTLLHPNHDPRDANSMNLYIPPDPRVAELEKSVATLTASQTQLARRLNVVESRR